jgi:gliding motility-associated lipoprotein GldH
MHYRRSIMKTVYILYLSLILFCLCTASCIRSNVYEKNVTMPYNKWHDTYNPIFSFDITDTQSFYNMYLTMRHTDAYRYANIWLNIKTTQPKEQVSSTVKVEVPLAQADGKWLSRGMNEIREAKMLLNPDGKPIRFTKKGIYKIQLSQIMRLNPLPEVMSIGIRLEKNS